MLEHDEMHSDIPHVLDLYQNPSELCYGEDYTLTSEWGMQQGCGYGMVGLVFSNAELIKQMVAQFSNCIIMGMADDIRLFGPVEEAVEAKRWWLQNCERANADKSYVSSSSQEAMDHPDVLALKEELGVKLVPINEGRRILGAPVGPKPWQELWLKEKGDDIEKVFDRIDELAEHDHQLSKQCAQLLTRQCAVPKYTHLLRGVDPNTNELASKRHDQRALRSYSKLMGPHAPLTEDYEITAADLADGFGEVEKEFAIRQVQLPMKKGGGGIMSAAEIAPAAFLGAAIDVLRFYRANPDFAPLITNVLTVEALADPELEPLLDWRAAWDSLSETIDEATLLVTLGDNVTSFETIGAAPAKSQKLLTDALLAARADKMADSSEIGKIGGPPSKEAAIRVMSSSDEGAAWLRALPYMPKLQMTNPRMADQLCFRFGVPQVKRRNELQSVQTECTCHHRHDATLKAAIMSMKHARRTERNRRKRRVARRKYKRVVKRRRPPRVDAIGHHDMLCNAGGGFHERHEAIQAALMFIARKAKVLVRKATVHELRADGETGQKQADVVFDNFGTNLDATLADVVAVHPSQAKFLNTNQYLRAGDAAQNRAVYKNGKYKGKAEECGYKFTDFAIETYGKMSQGSKKVLATIADQADDTYGSDDMLFNRGQFIDEARQIISISLQNAVSKMIAKNHLKRIGLTSRADSFMSFDWEIPDRDNASNGSSNGD
jgi:hypothetical protein